MQKILYIVVCWLIAQNLIFSSECIPAKTPTKESGKIEKISKKHVEKLDDQAEVCRNRQKHDKSLDDFKSHAKVAGVYAEFFYQNYTRLHPAKRLFQHAHLANVCHVQLPRAQIDCSDLYLCVFIG